MNKIINQLIEWQSSNMLSPLSEPIEASNTYLEDVNEFNSIFREKNISQITSQDLACKDYLVLSLSDNAFIYYLPRFLHLILLEDLDVFEESVIYKITPPMTAGKSRLSWLESVANLLTTDQKCLIYSVLLELSEKYTEKYNWSLYQESIEKYWGKYSKNS